VIGGLAVVLTVQARARRDLEVKNRELAEEQAKVDARFELAQKAVASFHSGDIQDLLLRNEQFKELRTVLLNQAAGFYGDMETLLTGQTDAKSRRALAAGYYQLAELTSQVGSRAGALAIHRNALAIRRELAAAPGADAGDRLDLARSLGRVGWLLRAVGDGAEGASMLEQQRDLAERLAAELPTAAALFFLAQSHSQVGRHLYLAGKPATALTAQNKAQAIFQKLADDYPANSEFQHSLSANFNNIGHELRSLGRMADALEVHHKALAILGRLANDYPTVDKIQMQLAGSYNNIGWVLWLTGKPAEALAAQREASAIRRRLADANPAVTEYQSDLAWCQDKIGNLLLQTGEPAAALEAYGTAVAIYQRMIAANPDNTQVVSNLAESHYNSGRVYAREKRFVESRSAYEAGLAILRKYSDADPDNAEYRDGLGCGYAFRGGANVRLGRPAEAAADLPRAMELWANRPPPDSGLTAGILMRLESARALALLAGVAKGPESGVTPVEAAAFADRAVVTLSDFVAAGWAQLDELKDPAFDTLRDRDIFRSLLAAVEARHRADLAK
jgi:tetratricopeptide (TPR) repeat protein